MLHDASVVSVGPIDGRFGRRSMRALQTFLVARNYELGLPDGWFGRRSTRALQSWLEDQGASPGPVDGRWGRRTTRALQLVLNKVRVEQMEKDRESQAKQVAEMSTEVTHAATTVPDGTPVPSAMLVTDAMTVVAIDK